MIYLIGQILGVIFLIMIVIAFIVSYLAHISMVKDNAYPYAHGSFKDFKRAFNLVLDWKRESRYPFSFFKYLKGSCTATSEIHASIIKFNDVGMILYPWSWLRFCLFLYKNRSNKKMNKAAARTMWYK